MITGRLSASCPSADSARTATITRAFGSVATCARCTRWGRCPGLNLSFASGSDRDTAVALDALRFGVGPDRGAASSNHARPPGVSAETPVDSPADVPAGTSRDPSPSWSVSFSTTDSSARKLFNAAFASTCVPSTIRRVPSNRPASRHDARTWLNNCSNTEEDANRTHCA